MWREHSESSLEREDKARHSVHQGLVHRVGLSLVHSREASIGGTLLTGGSGTIVGAFLGAVVLGFLKDGFTPSGVSVLETAGKVPGISLFGVLEGTAIGFLFIHALAVTVLELFMPRKKLVIVAVFDGILPREAREKARAAKDQFDNLYLIVDQQGRWEGQLLPDPAPRGLDPLLVGELKGSGGRKYFLIDQFDLTAAEQYLIDEFALKNGAELS